MTDKWLFVPKIENTAAPSSVDLAGSNVVDLSEYLLPDVTFVPTHLTEPRDPFTWPDLKYVYYPGEMQMQPDTALRALLEGDQLVYAYDGTGKCIGTVERSTTDPNWYDIVSLARTWQSEGDDRTRGQGGDQA